MTVLSIRGDISNFEKIDESKNLDESEFYFDVFVDFTFIGTIQYEDPLKNIDIRVVVNEGSSYFDGLFGEHHGEDTTSIHVLTRTWVADDPVTSVVGESVMVVVMDTTEPD